MDHICNVFPNAPENNMCTGSRTGSAGQMWPNVKGGSGGGRQKRVLCAILQLLRQSETTSEQKLQISRRGVVLLLRWGRSVLLPGGHRASRWVTGKGTCSGLALTCASLSLLLPGFGRHSSVPTLPTALPGPEHMTTTRQLPLLLKLEKWENILSGSARLVAVKDQHFRKGTVMALKQTETLSI